MSLTAPTQLKRPAPPETPEGIDLRVSVGSVSLKNPIIAASGTFGYGVEFAHLVDLAAWVESS
jgi:hypothetical protein